jgi:hypothetical protein
VEVVKTVGTKFGANLRGNASNVEEMYFVAGVVYGPGISFPTLGVVRNGYVYAVAVDDVTKLYVDVSWAGQISGLAKNGGHTCWKIKEARRLH